MFKKSSVLFGSVLCLSLVVQYESHGVKAFLMEKIVNPIKFLLPHHHHKNEHNNSNNEVEVEYHRMEHGTLDNRGRDIIRHTPKTLKKLMETFSKDAQGLVSNKTLSNGIIVNFKPTVQTIYPGTKWCGGGNIAKSYDDLGKFSTTDSCCREHDFCSEIMNPGATKYGLTNTGLFRRSHCDCDRKLYNCLKQAQSFVAVSIGYTYFTVLGPQCFREDYQILDCSEKKKGKCVKYLTKQGGDRFYQWFDSPVF